MTISDIDDQMLIEAVLLHHRKYEDTPEFAQRTVQAIDARISWLAARGLRPHPTVIERRAEHMRKSGTHSRRVQPLPSIEKQK